MGSGITRLPFVAAQYPGNTCWAISEHSSLTNMHHQLFPVHFPRSAHQAWYMTFLDRWRFDGNDRIDTNTSGVFIVYLPMHKTFCESYLLSVIACTLKGSLMAYTLAYKDDIKMASMEVQGNLCISEKNTRCWITFISVDIKIIQIKTKDDLNFDTDQNWTDNK